MNAIEKMDKSKQKIERRQIIHELTAREPAILATDYPGLWGRGFIRRLHKERSNLQITLVNKYSFRKDYPGDSLSGVVTKTRGDIFDVIQTHESELVDIDLFGGLSLEHWRKIETAPNWSKLLLTFTKVWRHRTKVGLLKAGEDPAMFMEMWCKDNHWKPPIMPQLPYRHPNKKAIMGLFDQRGPQYWTFLLMR